MKPAMPKRQPIPPTPTGCRQQRRWLQKKHSVNPTTGQLEADDSAATWVTGACGTPLFGDEDKKRGTCRSCASGWTHPENMPVADDAIVENATGK
jgi:peptide methionine sulfoxide reductase MsrB